MNYIIMKTMKVKTIDINVPKQIHYFVGTPGFLTIHCKEIIEPDDTIQFSNDLKHKLKVTELHEAKKSNYFPNHRFYEIKFDIV